MPARPPTPVIRDAGAALPPGRMWLGPLGPRDGTLFGALFESLERADRRVVAIEVKLVQAIVDADVRHLRWLQARLGADMLDAIVVTTGPYAYRRPDGIGVVPAALLGI